MGLVVGENKEEGNSRLERERKKRTRERTRRERTMKTKRCLRPANQASPNQPDTK